MSGIVSVALTMLAQAVTSKARGRIMRLDDFRRDTRGYGLPMFGLAACALTVAAVFGSHMLDRWTHDGTLARLNPANAASQVQAPRFGAVDMMPTGSIDRVRLDPCTGKAL